MRQLVEAINDSDCWYSILRKFIYFLIVEFWDIFRKTKSGAKVGEYVLNKIMSKPNPLYFVTMFLKTLIPK